MTKPQLLTLLQQSLRNNAGNRITPELYERAIESAVDRLSVDAPKRVAGVVELVAGQAEYPKPVGFFALLSTDYGNHAPELSAFCPLPVSLPETDGEMLEFIPAPTAQQVDVFGASWRYFWCSRYELGASSSTIPSKAEAALYLLALANVLLSLGAVELVEPIQLHKGLGDMQQPRTAADMHRLLMSEYRRELERINA